jgi:hypothetical protein
MNLGRKASLFVVHDNDVALGHRRYVRGAAATRQASALAVFFNPVSVKIAKAIHFRATDKTQIHPVALQ